MFKRLKDLEKLEKRVIMPDANTTFDLRREDLKDFEKLSISLFKDEIVDFFGKDESDDQWGFYEGNPLRFKSIYLEGDSFLLYFTSKSYNFPVKHIELTQKPKFAFLKDIEELKPVGLYLSQGAGLEKNPWVFRDEGIYVRRKETSKD